MKRDCDTVGLVVTGALLALLATACAQEPRSPVEERVARLAGELERWEAFGFSGAVLVAEDDRVLLSRGYGLANRQRAIGVTSRTLFDIGSLAKQFTAAAVLKLAEQGRLAIHDPVGLVLPDVPPDKDGVTVHHLLTHTSGLSDLGDESEPISRDALVKEALAAPLTTPPGTEYEYSNLGYSLLAAIVEIASGEPFEDYLTRELFRPAGLRDTGFTWARSDRVEETLALGYGGFAEPCAGEDPRGRADSWRRRGAGDVLSTTEDLWSWMRALTGGRVLGRASLDAMFTPHTTAEADFLSYGYGWRMQAAADDTRLIWHSGLEGAFSAMLRHHADDDVVLIFLSNLSIGGVPLRDVLVRPSRSGPPAAELFGEEVSAVPDRATRTVPPLDEYGGSFRVGEAGLWRLDVDGGTLALRAEGQEAVDALFAPPASARETGERAVGIARSIVEGTGETEVGLERIDPWGYAERDAARIAADWQAHRSRLGELEEITVLGTTGLRGRRSEQLLTWLRLRFTRGAVDEHLIWFADDEIYLVPCAPATFEIRFRPAPEGGLVGFDLPSQRVFRARLLDGGAGIALAGGDREIEALRIDWEHDGGAEVTP